MGAWFLAFLGLVLQLSAFAAAWVAVGMQVTDSDFFFGYWAYMLGTIFVCVGIVGNGIIIKRAAAATDSFRYQRRQVRAHVHPPGSLGLC
jgi:hypothetical protein